MSASLDIVIVSFRGKELLRRCLTSVREHGAGADMTVTVVDNASGDGTAEMVAAEFPEVTLLAQDENLGFARAQNIGIRRGRGAAVLVLNPDAALEQDTLEPLLQRLADDPRIGCCGPALIREDGSFDHAARRTFPTPLSALGHFTGVGRRMESGALADYRAPDVERGPVDAVNGAFMLLRRAALDDVGLFDEGYWMYMEDLDLCARLKEGGWITYYEPTSRALHTKAGTTEGRRGPRLNIAFHRGMGRFYRRHDAPGNGALTNFAVYAGIGVKLAISLVREALRD
ncbi:MAG: glycosyltransferase family 2 protein [Solirubrobacterales bacterium]